MRHRPDAVIIQSESAEYTHHVSAAFWHAAFGTTVLIFGGLVPG
jgi:hypothetical protein